MITFEAIDSLERAEALRVLRNECAVWMTRDTSQITPQQQARFYRDKIATGQIEGFLLRRGAEAVAYGLLRAAEGCWWLSCGVSAPHRGQGLGTALVRLVTTAGLDTGLPVRLEVWADNAAAARVYEKAGYVTEATKDREGRALKVMVAR